MQSHYFSELLGAIGGLGQQVGPGCPVFAAQCLGLWCAKHARAWSVLLRVCTRVVSALQWTHKIVYRPCRCQNGKGTQIRRNGLGAEGEEGCDCLAQGRRLQEPHVATSSRTSTCASMFASCSGLPAPRTAGSKSSCHVCTRG